MTIWKSKFLTINAKAYQDRLKFISYINVSIV